MAAEDLARNNTPAAVTAAVKDEFAPIIVPGGESASASSELRAHEDATATATTTATASTMAVPPSSSSLEVPSSTTHPNPTNPPSTSAATIDSPSSITLPSTARDTTTPQRPTSTTSLTVPPSPAYLSATGLGPATEGPIAPLPSATTETNPSTTTTTVLNISLMLTTGARHPYTLDEKYLHSRKVTTTVDKTTGDFDPRLLSGYQLKELIWIDWRSEWEPRPANPSFIRLILMGRMLEDKVTLREYPFNLSAVNVVHMTVKPADLHDDDDAAGAGKGSKSGHAGFRRGGGRDDDHEEDDRGAGCRCVIL